MKSPGQWKKSVNVGASPAGNSNESFSRNSTRDFVWLSFLSKNRVTATSRMRTQKRGLEVEHFPMSNENSVAPRLPVLTLTLARWIPVMVRAFHRVDRPLRRTFYFEHHLELPLFFQLQSISPVSVP